MRKPQLPVVRHWLGASVEDKPRRIHCAGQGPAVRALEATLPALLVSESTIHKTEVTAFLLPHHFPGIDQMEPLTVREGQRARLTFTNTSMMWHPMHLHGHTLQVRRADGTPGPRKDTVIVLPMQKIEVDLVADNPGYWMLHCHNGYHQDAGMMTRLDYRS